MKKDSLLIYLLAIILLYACSSSHYAAGYANEEIFKQEALQSASFGISLYDPARNSFLYNYQDEKYFVPASNTKLFSLYAGMKYLGDSLIGIRSFATDK